MEPRDTALDEVRHLVAERQRYDGWLTALEARRHDTPARVLARVHDDYQARRTEVVARLQAHVAGLEQRAAALYETVSRLEAEAATLDEERIEAHLRTLVGEFDPGRWEALQQDVEGRLALLADQRTDAALRLEEARDLLARARGDAPAGTREPSWLAEPVVPSEPPVPVSPVAPARSVAPSVVAVPGSLFEGVPERAEGGTPAPGDAGRPLGGGLGGAWGGALPSVPDDDEVDRALASLDERLPTADRPSTVGDSAQGDAVPDGPVGAHAVPSAPFDDLAFVRSLGEASAPAERKSLRCGECGTMNLPTEWYCERCGGELAAE
jgi:hypothetical protein